MWSRPHGTPGSATVTVTNSIRNQRGVHGNFRPIRPGLLFLAGKPGRGDTSGLQLSRRKPAPSRASLRYRRNLVKRSFYGAQDSVPLLQPRLSAPWFRPLRRMPRQTLPTVTLNNSPVTVMGAALTSGAVGLYQVDIQVPSSMPDGDCPVQVSIGGVTSPLGVILTVQQ